MSTFDEKFRGLPPEVKDAVVSEDILNAAEELAKQFSLRLDAEGLLVEAITDTMVGITSPQDFVPRIQKELGIPKETAVEITKAVNATIFLPIRDSLKKIHEGNVAHAAETPVTHAEATASDRGDFLKGIESPESIPMKQVTVNVKPLMPLKPVAPVPPPPKPPVIPVAPIPAPAPVLAPTPAPVTPPPATAPAPKAPSGDPYRELS